MARLSISQLIASIERIDADPTQINHLLQQLSRVLLAEREGKASGRREGEPEDDERERLEKALNSTPVILTTGRTTTTTTWGKLVRDLFKDLPNELLKNVTKENIYQMWPFKDLGNIPIATTRTATEAPDVTHVRDLGYLLNGSSQTRLSLVSPDMRSQSIIIHMHKEWWTIPFVVTQYTASTRVTTDGLDAADLAGGVYAQAKQICDTLVVPPNDPNGIVAFIKALAIGVARSTPETPFPVFQIRSMACPKCHITDSQGHCHPDCNNCSCDVGNWVSEWTSHFTEPLGPSCVDVASEHMVWFNPPPGYPSEPPGDPDFDYVFC